jgi:hypothetical protein
MKIDLLTANEHHVNLVFGNTILRKEILVSLGMDDDRISEPIQPGKQPIWVSSLVESIDIVIVNGHHLMRHSGSDGLTPASRAVRNPDLPQ